MLCNVYNLSISNLVFSFLYSLPHTQLCSVLLWACASALQTLLKSLSGSTRSFVRQSAFFSSLCFVSSLLHHPARILLWNFILFLFFSCICCHGLIAIKIWMVSLLSLAFTRCHRTSQEPLCSNLCLCDSSICWGHKMLQVKASCSLQSHS